MAYSPSLEQLEVGIAMIRNRNQDERFERLKVGEDIYLLPEATCTAFLQRPVSRSLGRD